MNDNYLRILKRKKKLKHLPFLEFFFVFNIIVNTKKGFFSFSFNKKEREKPTSFSTKKAKKQNRNNRVIETPLFCIVMMTKK